MIAGCRTLVVASRSAALPRDTLEEFAKQGVAVFVVHGDSADASATAAILGWARRHLPAITHHAHAAGVTGQTLLKVSKSLIVRSCVRSWSPSALMACCQTRAVQDKNSPCSAIMLLRAGHD